MAIQQKHKFRASNFLLIVSVGAVLVLFGYLQRGAINAQQQNTQNSAAIDQAALPEVLGASIQNSNAAQFTNLQPRGQQNSDSVVTNNNTSLGDLIKKLIEAAKKSN